MILLVVPFLMGRALPPSLLVLTSDSRPASAAPSPGSPLRLRT